MNFLRGVLDIVFAQPNGPRAQPTGPTSMVEISARSPIFCPNPKKDRFLDVVFATRVLQNHMFRQALGSPKHFRRRIHPDNLRERKII